MHAARGSWAQLTSPSQVDFDEFLLLMYKKKLEEEDDLDILEAFKVFDKKDRNQITIQDLKVVFDEYLDISKQELEEIYN